MYHPTIDHPDIEALEKAAADAVDNTGQFSPFQIISENTLGEYLDTGLD